MKLRTRILGATVYAVLFLCVAAANQAHAQALDAFNPGANGEVLAMAIQADHKILVGGSFTGLGGGFGATSRLFIGRLNVDGSVDSSFDPGASGVVHAIAVQDDGKILVGGRFTRLGGGGAGNITRNRLGRLNPDGTVDSTFNPDVNGDVLGIDTDPLGRVVIVGRFTSVAGEPRLRIARLSADGTLDAAFNPGADGDVFTVLVRPDNVIVVGGEFQGLGFGTGAVPRSSIGALDPADASGWPSPSFNPGADGPVYSLAWTIGRQMLVGGAFSKLGNGATVPRNNIGRLDINGEIDPSFDPGANGTVTSLVTVNDGRLIVGGAFTVLGGAPRAFIGDLASSGAVGSFNPGANAPVAAVAVGGNGSVLLGGSFSALGGGTGTTPRAGLGRFGIAPSAYGVLSATTNLIDWHGGPMATFTDVEFFVSTDGINYSSIGRPLPPIYGSKHPFVSLPSDNPRFRVRTLGKFRGGAGGGSGSRAIATAPLSGVNLVVNGDFSDGTNGWQLFATPTMSFMPSDTTGGVLSFDRVAPPAGTTNQAVVFQRLNASITTGNLRARLQLGNSEATRKRVSILLHEGNFSDRYLCTFWLPPSSPLQTYEMDVYGPIAWTDATISIYAASVDGGPGSYLLDNVTFEIGIPGGAPARSTTFCFGPPSPPSSSAGYAGSLITNGGFDSGGLGPWTTFGQITGAVNNGVFEFMRLPGTPAGVVLQSSSMPLLAYQGVDAFLSLGNSSANWQRVTVILHDADFSDLVACTFRVAPGQSITSAGSNEIFGATTKAWTNPTISIYPANDGASPWLRLDDVVFVAGGGPTGGTDYNTYCYEEYVGDVLPPERERSSRAVGTQSPDRSRGELLLVDGWLNDGFIGTGQLGSAASIWVARADTTVRRVLELAEPIDLTAAESAGLTLRSWLTAARSRASIQVTTDGVTWETIHVVSPSDTWLPLEIDLSDYVGSGVRLRFVFDGEAGEQPADVWRIQHVRMD